MHLEQDFLDLYRNLIRMVSMESSLASISEYFSLSKSLNPYET
jgi:transcriptional regulator of nitric oxide reductase